MPYFSYVHSIICYGMIFMGSNPNSSKIFGIKKLRIITNSKKIDSCKKCLNNVNFAFLFSVLFVLCFCIVSFMYIICFVCTSVRTTATD